MRTDATRRAALLLAVTIAMLTASCVTAGEPTGQAGGSPAAGGREAAAPATPPDPSPADAGRICVASLPAGATVSPIETARVADGPATVRADDFFFDPTCVLMGEAGDRVQLTVRNTGDLLHNIRIDELGIDHDVVPGESVTVELEVLDRPLLYVCTYHAGSGMVGVVLPAAEQQPGEPRSGVGAADFAKKP